MPRLGLRTTCCDDAICPRRTQPVLAHPREVPAACGGRVDPWQARSLLGFAEVWQTPGAARVIAAWNLGGTRTALLDALQGGDLVLLAPLVTEPSAGNVQRPDQPETPDVPIEPPTHTDWIKFRVIDDETGEPLPGVTVRLRAPNGVERDYVTRPDGRIEVDPALPPDCDIVEVISTPLLEVLRVE